MTTLDKYVKEAADKLIAKYGTVEMAAIKGVAYLAFCPEGKLEAFYPVLRELSIRIKEQTA